MRLAAQMRGGFYPAPAEAVAQAASFLRPPAQEPFTILDPCAGEGAAIGQLAELLGCAKTAVYAIELDDSRADKLRAALPEAHVLAPANFFGCRASLNSLSLIWLNPPFDDAYGGHRMEQRFLLNATDWLMPGGIMALVCPEGVADEYSDVRSHFAAYYEHCQIVPFPQRHRRFQEVIVLGRKRSQRLGDRRSSWEDVQAPAGFLYPIPAGSGPRVFQKIEPTEPELARLLARSPLRDHLTAAPVTTVSSPPLALDIGHVALLLASGHLDGVVQPADRPPHVVRGTARKQEYVSDVSNVVNPDGSTTKRTILSERIELIVRTVDATGTIQSFMGSEAS